METGLMRFAALATVLGGMAAAAAPDSPPVAPERPVTDVYFGTKVADPYRWMENRTAPEFIHYMLAQGKYARDVIDSIPGRDRLQARVVQWSGGGAVVRGVQKAGQRIFFLKREASEDVFKLYVRDGASAPDRLLVDPAKYTEEHTHYSIDYFQPSQQGERLAYGMSGGGSEHSVIHVIDVASGKALPESIDRAEFGGISWLPDASGFFYNRNAAVGPNDPDTARYLNSCAMLHRLGTDPVKDISLIGTNVAGSPQVRASDYPYITVQPGTDQAFAMISHGSEPAVELLVAPLAEAMRAGAHWRKFADSPDGVISVALHGTSIYLLTHKDAPHYRIVVLDLKTLDWKRAATVVPESRRVIIDIEPAPFGLYIRDLDGGLGRLRRLNYATGKARDIALPVDGTLVGLSTDPLRQGAQFSLQSWLRPEAWYATNGAAVAPLGLEVLASENIAITGSTAVRLRFTDGRTVQDVIRALAGIQFVAVAQPQYVYRLHQQGGDTTPASRGDDSSPKGDPAQYILEKLKLSDVHRMVRGTNVTIAVIDSQIDAAHPDLEGVIAERFSAVGAPEKPHSHGTGMAGAIASHQRLIDIRRTTIHHRGSDRLPGVVVDSLIQSTCEVQEPHDLRQIAAQT